MMKLYVGNLNYGTSEDDLRQTFGAYGELSSVAVIMDRETGRSKGFGFVEFVNDEDGKAAIEAMDGKEVGGRSLKVNEARPRESSGGGFGGRGGSRGGDRRPSGGGRGGDRGGWR
jgi:RNA recognition motif-containing protein